MYQPPPGRPISSPPSTEHLNGSSLSPHCEARGKRYTAEERAAVRSDYLAGMPYAELKAKYGIGSNKSLARLVSDIKNRRQVVKPTAPTIPPRPVRMEGENKSAYGVRVQVWMRQTDPEYAARVSANKRAGQLRLAKKRKMAKLRAERRAAEVAATPAADIPHAIVAAPPPTLWQRIVGWFR